MSRRLARCHLTLALFPSPRASRSMTVSVSRALSSSQACCPKATSDMPYQSGSPHLAYRMATAYRPPVPLRLVHDLLVLAFKVVTPTTTMGTPFPCGSRLVGNPVFHHDETSRASWRCLIHHLHESSLLPILSVRVPKHGYLISSTERPCSQAFFQGMCASIIGG